MVSLSQRAVAAISYEVEPVDENLSVVVQSELVANEPLPIAMADPRTAAVLEAPLRSEDHGAVDAHVVLLHSTKRSAIRMAAAMDHEIDGPPGVQCDAESFPDVGRVTVTTTLEPGAEAADGQIHRLRVVDAALGAGGPGPGGRRPQGGPEDRMGRAAGRAAGLPRQLLGPGRCRGRRRPRGATSRALRAVSRPSGRGQSGAAGHSGQGTHRSGLRRSLLLGHRDLRPADAHVLVASGRRRRPPLAPEHPADGRRAGNTARTVRRRLPMADDRRRGVLGVLARRDGGISRQCRHRRRGHPLCRGHRRRDLRARHRPRAPGPDGAAVALPRPPRRRRPFSHRRCHRPRRVQRHRRQQRLHQLDGSTEPVRCGRHRGPAPPPCP